MATAEAFIEFCLSFPIIEPGSAEAEALTSDHQALLKILDIIVEGELEGTSKIIAFSMRHMKTVEINRIDLVKMENLIQWFGEEITEHVWSGFGEKPPGVDFTLQQVKRAIAAEGGKKQVRENDRRGAGVWESSGRLLYVGEHELAVVNGSMERLNAPQHEGTSVQFGTCEQWYDFDKLSEYIDLAKDPAWRWSVRDEMFELFSRWDNWSKPYDAELVTSLVMCTWLQTVWKWRPLVFVTGPTNSGKSMLLEETLPAMFGPVSLFMQKASEAGLRQSIQQSAKIAILDEFESGKDRQAILELARTSGRGGQIVKGTASQKATVFGLKHILWCGAIETGLHQAADRNRFIMLELKRVVKKKGDKMLAIPSCESLNDLGMRALAVVSSGWKQIQALARDIQDEGFEGFDHRLIESYSLPCAVLAWIDNPSDPNGYGITKEILEKRDLKNGLESDEPDLLGAIFGSIVRTGKTGDKSIGELLFKEQYDIESIETLHRSGLCEIDARTDKPARVFISPKSVGRHLLKDTDYRYKKISEMLLRVEGSEMCRAKLCGQFVRGISIPKEEIAKLMSSDGEDDQVQSGDQPQAAYEPSSPSDVF